MTNNNNVWKRGQNSAPKPCLITMLGYNLYNTYVTNISKSECYHLYTFCLNLAPKISAFGIELAKTGLGPDLYLDISSVLV